MLMVSISVADDQTVVVTDAEDVLTSVGVLDELWCVPSVSDEIDADVIEIGVLWCDVAEVILASVASVGISDASIGDVSSAVVMVSLSESIVSPSSDYTMGVTIAINGTPATITSATLQSGSMHVAFDLAASVDANDVITFAYVEADGDWQVSSGVSVADIGATSVTNDVGSHLYFDESADAVHIASV